ncbi:MAG: mitochondrial 54S ribosomal protein L40 [Ktedonobacteraceae bacterium]|nr:mitochondrial 54S ribosomal protein L40 [Ktedonobacteraceae bacterium]
MTHLPGDSVRIRSGDDRGQKGTIQMVTAEHVEILLENGERTRVSPLEITNYSLAARKAWQTMRTHKKRGSS